LKERSQGETGTQGCHQNPRIFYHWVK